MSNLLSLLLAALALCPARASAALPPLTLPALQLELETRSPELHGRRAEARAAAERPAQARAFADPEFMTELWQTPTSLSQVPLMFTLRQPVIWPGKLRARARALEPEIKRARAAALSTLRELRLQAARVYYDYRLASRSIDVLSASQGLLRTIVAAVDARYRVGRAELAELLKTQEELASLDTQLFELERQRDAAVSDINALLDLPADHPQGEPVTTPVLRPLPALSELTERALAQRPEIQAADAALAHARAQLSAARVERAPDLAVWASYMTQLRGGASDTFTVGVQTSLPSFSLSRSAAAAREGAALSEASAADASQARARVRAEVQKAVLRLMTAERHIRLHRDTLIPLAERSVEAARASFQSGRGSLVLLLEATRALLNHRLDHERFEADYGQRWAELEAASGAGGAP